MPSILGNGDFTFNDGTSISTAGITSSAASGYYRLPNGILMQWGTGTATSVPANSNTTTTTTFPIAFTTVYRVIVSAQEAAGSATNFCHATHLSSQGNSSFVTRFVGANNGCPAGTLTPKYVAFGV